MIDAHRPSQDGLRRTPTPGASRRRTPSAELSGSESVSSLLPLPPHSATPSQRPGTGDNRGGRHVDIVTHHADAPGSRRGL